MTPATRGAAERVRLAYHALGEGDSAPLLDQLADDVTWVETEGNLVPGTYRGKAAVAQEFLPRLAAAFDPPHIAVEAVHDAGEVVVVLGTYGGRTAGNHAAVEARFVHLWHLQAGSGLVARFEQVADTVLLHEAAQGRRLRAAAPSTSATPAASATSPPPAKALR